MKNIFDKLYKATSSAGKASGQFKTEKCSAITADRDKNETSLPEFSS